MYNINTILYYTRLIIIIVIRLWKRCDMFTLSDAR